MRAKDAHTKRQNVTMNLTVFDLAEKLRPHFILRFCRPVRRSTSHSVRATVESARARARAMRIIMHAYGRRNIHFVQIKRKQK